MVEAAKKLETVKNRLLLALPGDERERMLSKLEEVKLEIRQVLHEPEEPIEYVYFPNDAMISLLSLLADGSTIEVGVLGCEGMSGIASLLSTDSSPYQALVQTGGTALRTRREVVQEEFERDGSFRTVMLRYTRMLLGQTSQVAACNGLHTIDERLARWLLMGRDRVHSNYLPLTQEFLSHMLGVRRSGVTVAARTLQQAGLINYNRGRINILDEQGLEQVACECYAIIKEEFDNFLDG
ncbi:MAG TPA: Crp/Fnr family transcriptional regulator [Pyrinomonadaceae bacterium]|nr:Crp/Fnr family transcriptional regulator [Pyrinomonadaceae bacterium]